VPEPDIVGGFNRQRKSLLATSLVLLAFQSVDAQLRSISLFGNSIELSAPLRVVTPLWVAWVYFLIRYYQYLRDLGDKGLHAAYRNRLVNLANSLARRHAARLLPLDLAGLTQPLSIRLDITDIFVRVPQPPPWEYEVTGAAHIDEKPPATGGRMQVLEKERFTLPSKLLVLPHIRAVWWVIAHTRLASEYALPLIVAALPTIRPLVDGLAYLLVAV
jgi:hypothetical protein